MGWFVVDIVRKKLSGGLLALTPNGAYHRSWAFHSYVPWHAIASVATGKAREGPVITMGVFTNNAPSSHQPWAYPAGIGGLHERDVFIAGGSLPHSVTTGNEPEPNVLQSHGGLRRLERRPEILHDGLILLVRTIICGDPSSTNHVPARNSNCPDRIRTRPFAAGPALDRPRYGAIPSDSSARRHTELYD